MADITDRERHRAEFKRAVRLSFTIVLLLTYPQVLLLLVAEGVPITFWVGFFIIWSLVTWGLLRLLGADEFLDQVPHPLARWLKKVIR